MTARQRNPRAFAIQSVNKMARKVRRYAIHTVQVSIVATYYHYMYSD